MNQLDTTDLGAGWTSLAGTNNAASFASCGVLTDSSGDAMIVYAGGWNGGNSLATVEIYDVIADTWR